MATHVALLRGINVGGQNKVPMAVLEDNPYPDEPNPKLVQVVFLSAEPPKDLLDRVAAAESAAESVAATARNWATSTKLLSLCD